DVTRAAGDENTHKSGIMSHESGIRGPGSVKKSEIRNPKLETNPKSQIPNSFGCRILNLFRISSFGFRIFLIGDSLRYRHEHVFKIDFFFAEHAELEAVGNENLGDEAAVLDAIVKLNP